MTIFFPVPETFPDPRARFIQIMNTASALASSGRRTRLLIGVAGGKTARDVLDYYGIGKDENLEIVPLPIMRKGEGSLLRLSWHGLFNIFLIKHLVFNLRKGDVVFLRHLKLASFLLRRRWAMKAPVVFDAHEIFSLSTDAGGKGSRLSEMEKDVYGNVDALVTLTRHLKEEVERRFDVPGPRVFVVPDGVRDEWLRPAGPRPEDGPVFYAGSLYPWKGVDVLIRAMKLLPGERLAIAGGGGRLDELRRAASDEGVAGRVEFLGPLRHEEVRSRLFGARVAVLPNIDEGPSRFSSPLKLFEYMAAGLPIVATDLPGFSDVLTHGVNAYLVKPGDPHALAAGIRYFIENPAEAERIGREAARGSREYTYARRAERLGVVFDLALRGRGE